jgi:hypothetical protein
MAKYDPYTCIKLLTNLTEQTFKITDINYDKLDFLNWKYAILTINENIYITYSKVIINQLKSGSFINVEVVLKEFRTNEFSNMKYHKLYSVSEGLL